ncbi:MAG: 3-deoxy-manno-octulosonate cytidylyltransferase [Gemmatimonadota bacterium]|nr:3-deoxy-manno-octulosonate cytidylyltransferase [Gemmatimonadota bacterium]
MNAVGIIAARMASTRFPGKPLVPLRGIPMLGHVYYRSRIAAGLDDIWIATCDQAILDYASSIGAKAVLTRETHERATDRIAEALPFIEELTGKRIDIATLIQGDEPLLVPAMLDELVAPMRSGGVPTANLMSPILDADEFEDPNTVKVVCDQNGYALYFSREPIPSRRKYSSPVPMWKQLGMIGFTRSALLEYTTLAPTPLEQIESVDMNRLLEHGRQILMVETSHQTSAVDTPQDLSRVEALMAGDKVIQSYLQSS